MRKINTWTNATTSWNEPLTGSRRTSQWEGSSRTRAFKMFSVQYRPGPFQTHLMDFWFANTGGGWSYTTASHQEANEVVLSSLLSSSHFVFLFYNQVISAACVRGHVCSFCLIKSNKVSIQNKFYWHSRWIQSDIYIQPLQRINKQHRIKNHSFRPFFPT